jgi:cytochrome c oxidase subunit 2
VPLATRRPAAAGRSRARRRLGLLALVLAPLALSGCSVSSFGAHPSATVTGRQTYHLWQGFTIGAIVVGGITLALIVYAAVRYKAREGDRSLPRQSQYHLPMEIIYTVIPVLIVLVLFAFTVVVENNVTALPSPAVTIRVDASQWGWKFTYPGPVSVAGQTTSTPTMVMPENEQVRVILTSQDVIHAFYVRDFNFSRQALPGIVNEFTFNATQTGLFFGQCTQYCGLYHSVMFFQVQVMTQPDYAAWLRSQQTLAGKLQGIAGESSSASQENPGIPVKPDIGGGTN